MTDKRISDMPLIEDGDINWDADVAPIISANTPALSQKNKTITLSTLRPQPLGPADTPNFAGILLGGVPIAEALNIRTAKDNLGAVDEPTVDNDETEGYSVGSRWYDIGDTPAVFLCLDATEGAAVWVESSLSIDDLGTAATKNVGTVGDYVPVLNARNQHKHVGYTLASSSSSAEIDWSAGDYHIREIEDNTAFTFSNVPTTGPAILYLTVKTTGTPDISFSETIPHTIDAHSDFVENATHLFQIHTVDGVSFSIAAHWNMSNYGPLPPEPSKGLFWLKTNTTTGPMYGPFLGVVIEDDAFSSVISTYSKTYDAVGAASILGAKSTGQPYLVANTGSGGVLEFWPFDEDGTVHDQVAGAIFEYAIGQGLGGDQTAGSKVAWHPSGDFVAIVTDVGINPGIKLFAWDDSTGLGELVASRSWTNSTGPSNYSLSWSPSGAYLAVYGLGPAGSPLPSDYRKALLVYPYTGSPSYFGAVFYPETPVFNVSAGNTRNSVRSAAWVSDTRLLVSGMQTTTHSTTGFFDIIGGAFSAWTEWNVTGEFSNPTELNVCVSDDKTRILAANRGNGRFLALYEYDSGTVTKIHSLSASADGNDQNYCLLGFLPGETTKFMMGTAADLRLMMYDAGEAAFTTLDLLTASGNDKAGAFYRPTEGA